jgi:Flp pilus assembly protein TadG
MQTLNNQKGIKKIGVTFCQDEKGAITVLIALTLTVLLGFVGLALDIGNLFVVKTKMQNAVDAAVCAGGLKLPDQSQATAQAQTLLTNNNFNPAIATITFTQDAVRNPANDPEINCRMTNNVPTYFMSLFGYNPVAITVSAEGVLSSQSNPGGAFNYTIFSGSPSDTLILNGSQTVKGSVHANYKLIVNGSSNISGAAEGVKHVTVNGSNQIGSVAADTPGDVTVNGSNQIGSITGGATDIAMPDFSQQIADTAVQVYNSNKIFNGSVNVDGSIYVNGTATLNGSIDSTGAILATGNIIVNGSSSISGTNQVCLYSANGNITVNGSSFIGSSCSAVLYAPNGQVIINGSANFQGRIIANKVIINGSGTFNGEDYPITSLPAGKNHVKLIK